MKFKKIGPHSWAKDDSRTAVIFNKEYMDDLEIEINVPPPFAKPSDTSYRLYKYDIAANAKYVSAEGTVFMAANELEKQLGYIPLYVEVFVGEQV